MMVGTASVLQCAFNRKPIEEMVPDWMETTVQSMGPESEAQ